MGGYPVGAMCNRSFSCNNLFAAARKDWELLHSSPRARGNSQGSWLEGVLFVDCFLLNLGGTVGGDGWSSLISPICLFVTDMQLSKWIFSWSMKPWCIWPYTFLCFYISMLSRKQHPCSTCMQIAKVSEQKWKTLTQYGFSASGLPETDTDSTPVIIHMHIHYLKVRLWSAFPCL